ncbi:Pol polyprotein [Plakobranchus ocellatus]|uniref:Pol polyprotein n=1 Tax=Plakobranchus ocellatus TaxID=259542 RepID=A0AAV4CZW8_9GAST|nr:Pol polyprotein [Plakobranchus ocellatus]
MPEIIISDNGPQYTEDYEIIHRTSSTLHPQSKGETGRAVKAIKNLLRKVIHPYLSLLNYRATPLQSGFFIPAESMMSKALRTKVSMLRKLLQPKRKHIDSLKELIPGKIFDKSMILIGSIDGSS